MKNSATIVILLLLLKSFSLPAAEVVCTSYPVRLLTSSLISNIPGHTLRMMTPQHGGCAHNYTPRPGDLTTLKNANTILVANGSNNDAHIVAAAQRINPQLQVIDLTVPAIDQHTFASPDTAELMLIKLAEAMQKLDPVNAELYQRNLEKIQQGLQ